MRKTNNIERDRLDYLLTDTMPVEVSELFSFGMFYDYLFGRRKELDAIVNRAKEEKAGSAGVPLTGSWASTPLKYEILKGTDSVRQISLVQPLAAMNMYCFVECYQKEILDLLRENGCFSVRYHRKNKDLYYRSRKGRGMSYFMKEKKKMDKSVLQQTGAYFKLFRFGSLTDFTKSRIWRNSNFRYRSFAKADYKSCFDSIYTHAYKWCITKDTVDSKEASNSNLHVVIDRVLQNLNGRSSHGLIVGPEFSRMIAEVLLGQIDTEVRHELAQKGLRQWRDYRVFRYVDDIYIFSHSREDTEQILAVIESVSRRYKLQLNQRKVVMADTPVIPSLWLGRTRYQTDRIAKLFTPLREVIEAKGEKPLVKRERIDKERMKDDFLLLMHDYPGDQRYIVSYMLSTLLNNIGNKKRGMTLFDPDYTGVAFVLLDLAFYYYSFCPCFEHTQKLLSMLVYMDDELCFKKDENSHKRLQNMIRRYSFIFEKGNLNDLCNWFLFFREYDISLKRDTEAILESRLEAEDNPLLWANYMIYSRYDPDYRDTIIRHMNELLKERLNQLSEKELMMRREFWYILVFINCPDVSQELKVIMNEKLEAMRYRKKPGNSKQPTPISAQMVDLIIDFLMEKKANRFFYWGYFRFDVSKQMTFRTYQRTLFKQYRKKGSQESYGSLET